MKNIVIIGATSNIAHETAKLYAQQGAQFYLLARNAEKLSVVAADLQVRSGQKVWFETFDHKNYAQHADLVKKIRTHLDTIDVVLIAHGSLPEQKECEKDFAKSLEAFEVNFLSAASFLNEFANIYEVQRSGTLIAISSVAGDRGRQSNYVYGSAKAALTVYADGLRNRLFKSNAHVMTVKPGFVDTPMTASFQKGPLWASPQTIAKGIVQAEKKKKNTLYTPWYWHGIMFIIKSIPDLLFKRLKL